MRDIIAQSLDDAFQEGLVLYVEELVSQLGARGMCFHDLLEACSTLADVHGFPDSVVSLLEEATKAAENYEQENLSQCDGRVPRLVATGVPEPSTAKVQ